MKEENSDQTLGHIFSEYEMECMDKMKKELEAEMRAEREVQKLMEKFQK